jgi:hypothetical protein
MAMITESKMVLAQEMANGAILTEVANRKKVAADGYLKSCSDGPVADRPSEPKCLRLSTRRRDNVGLVIDFWHLRSAGAIAEPIAKLNPDIIFCVYFATR